LTTVRRENVGQGDPSALHCPGHRLGINPVVLSTMTPDTDFLAARRIYDQHLVVPFHQAIVDVPGFATGLDGNASSRLTWPQQWA
jgi:hypothetical protein